MKFFKYSVLLTTILPAFLLPVPMTSQDKVPGGESVVEAYTAVSPSGIRKLLFIGDSMSGWMAERMNAYGKKNGFDVATVVWDGSTIRKWGDSRSLQTIVDTIRPDGIMVSLGMNELFDRNPATRLKPYVENMKSAFGDIPYLWIGPPSWPGHEDSGLLGVWLREELGDRNYYDSSGLDMQRQSKSNPHPSRQGIEMWIDSVAEWIPDNSNLKFDTLENPGPGVISRGKTFVYKRMKEKL